MVIEKIKDDALRQKIEAMIEGGRNISPEFIRDNPEFLERLPFKDDYAVWLPPDSKVIKVGESVEKPADMVLPTLVLEHFIRNSSHRVIMNFCGCREIKYCKDYPIEYGCLFLGDAAKDIHPELGRPATVDEAFDYVRQCREAGLIHHLGYIEKDSVWLEVNPSKRLLTVCSCCPCCCCVMSDSHPPEARSIHHILKMPGAKVTVTDDCIACGTCEETCTFSAVTMVEEQAVINDDQCMACGRCVEACPEDAIEIAIEDSDYIKNTIEKISEKTDCT